MLWLDLAIAMSCGGAGLVCGWIMHAIGGFGNHTLVKQAAASMTPGDSSHEPTVERVTEVASRLRDYAIAMSADVDAHQTKVQAVNNSLLEDSDASPEMVIEAVAQLIEANQVMQSQLQQAQDQIHEQAERIESAERRATTDALTRVPNRGAFDAHIEKRHRCGPLRAGTLALLDVDHFKKFNDVYGHRAGDEVLKIVARILHSKLQSFGLVARYGGEEFAVIFDDCPVHKAIGYLEAARIAIGEREIEFEGKRMRVSASAGVAELMDSESVEQWLQRADDGLYASKEAGRDCGHWMDETRPVRIKRAANLDAVPKPTPRDADSNSDSVDGQSDGASSSDASPADSTNTPDQVSKAPVSAKNDEQDLGIDDLGLEELGLNFDDDQEPAVGKPEAFAYLPDRKTLGEAYREICGRAGASVTMFLMAVRCDSKVGSQAMKSLLQIVRASMRTVDRIGCDDDATLLICMPSVDAAVAQARKRQILQSASALGLSNGTEGNESATRNVDPSQSAVQVGVVQAIADEEFADVVSRAVSACQESSESTETVNS